MKKIKTNFKGLYVFKGKTFFDKRGFLREAFKKKIIKKNLIFSIFSKSKKNVLRGLHLQTTNAQEKFLTVIKGKILDVAVDLRKNSKTFSKHFKVILSDKNSKHLLIPRGFAHGFLSLEKESVVLYNCSNYRHQKSEKSILWNDKNLKINWGTKKPIVSKKDRRGLTLKEFLKK